MNRTFIVLALVLPLLGGTACKNTDALIAEKDRRYNEAQAEIEGLRRRIAQLENVNAVQGEELAALKRARTDTVDDREKLRARIAELEDQAVSAREPASNTRSLADGVTITTLGSGDIVVTLDSTVTFSSGSHELSEAGRKAVLGPILREIRKYPGHVISLEGHTDDEPLAKTRQVYGSNLNLSIARANAVYDLLRTGGKIDPRSMRVVGWGEHRPRVPGGGEEARAANRRVELVLIKDL